MLLGSRHAMYVVDLAFKFAINACLCVLAYLRMCMAVCYNIENVKEQHQGEAESQSIQRERKHP